ncbi:hypothetical protein KMW28_27050 [Flammeovirga yaeyamensis]|uniref:Uncharacterized protein n=1 Tax=Flammeovirga yaeyamensis TaxID=367791 RepID=A0AAX1NAI7_9BACT|nr:hypothetical protein [Flammeovirga yaeyamensis]MBB3700064.1 mRNA-degrading endonuclease HigB of HigAB toxin-antitoxin module [Flammeovirga yaeyamensis]NMF37501.1 hypothetical protein [Flammeovirga yaeyamensis]QWG04558.1 hypothetical protein KMW28_27050 [Flammeovirga yaeyamensis]
MSNSEAYKQNIADTAELALKRLGIKEIQTAKQQISVVSKILQLATNRSKVAKITTQGDQHTKYYNDKSTLMLLAAYFACKYDYIHVFAQVDRRYNTDEVLTMSLYFECRVKRSGVKLRTALHLPECELNHIKSALAMFNFVIPYRFSFNEHVGISDEVQRTQVNLMEPFEVLKIENWEKACLGYVDSIVKEKRIRFDVSTQTLKVLAQYQIEVKREFIKYILIDEKSSSGQVISSTLFRRFK